MSRNPYDAARKAIRDYIEAEIIGDDAPLKRLIACTTFDLYHGPSGAYEPDGDGWIYPGFERACDAIRGSILADIGTLYYLPDCGSVVTTEPEGYEEDGEWCDADEYMSFDAADARRAYLGTLADYL